MPKGSSDRPSTRSAQWQGRLRSKGYRLTPQRQLVLEAVAALRHATPEEIINYVREVASGVNMSTVYRTLDLLEELSLVTHTHLGHGAPTYHVAEDAGHVHLVCSSCGAVTEVGSEVVQSLIQRLDDEHGFAADVHHFAIFGRCSTCRSTT
ncbi:MAG: transcriptional repressor [Acidothermus cellulolyticus]|nr:transcriptional repressor [Acidothermus cellulolyticus]